MKDFDFEKESIIRKYGEWTAYDIKLTETLYTKDIRQPNPPLKKLWQWFKISHNVILKPSILDLACLEGHYAIEFALQGATVVGIEGRIKHTKAIFAKDTLNLANVTFIKMM